MLVSARSSQVEERLFDEVSLGSAQPSDEWGNYEDDVPMDERYLDSQTFDAKEPMDERYLDSQTFDAKEPMDESYLDSQTFDAKESYFSNQSSFADYLTHLYPAVPTVAGLGAEISRSFSTVTYSKMDAFKSQSKVKKSARSPGRCIIENTESIERRDEQKQLRAYRMGDDCIRDESEMSCSVEEISQISEITMDIPTVAAEQKFRGCSALPTISEVKQALPTISEVKQALPTISEVKQFNKPQIAAACASEVRENVQCSTGADTTMNQDEGNNDFMDFVFELVEDAICKPMKTSKAERKKVFMEAFQEESKKVVKLAQEKASRDHFRDTSKHSRGSAGTKRSDIRLGNLSAPEDERNASASESVEIPMSTLDHNRMKIVDKPPPQPSNHQAHFPLDEEVTIDWSKMMSLAEKQFEGDEGSLGSKDSRISEVSKLTEKSSFYQSIKDEDSWNNDDSIMTDEKSKIAKTFGTVPSTLSTSLSTHATVADDVDNGNHTRLTDDVVNELRELSALDSSSFEEESNFMLTTTLFRTIGSLIPTFDQMKKKIYKYDDHEERAFDEISVAFSLPSMHEDDLLNEETGDDEMTLKMLRILAFCCAFVLWPSGIARQQIPQEPLRLLKKTLDSKPKSLLQLVSENSKY